MTTDNLEKIMPTAAAFFGEHWFDLISSLGLIVSLILSFMAFRVSAKSDARSKSLELSERRILIGEKHVAAEKIMRNFPAEIAAALSLWKLDLARRNMLASSMWEQKQSQSASLLQRGHDLRLQYSSIVSDLESQDGKELERRVVRMADALASAEVLQASISRPAL